MRTTLIVIGSIIGLFLLIFLANEFSIFGTKFWGVRQQNARREVFEQTQSYVEGKRQELIKLHHEWNKASADDKIAIEATIRMNFANFDESKIEQPELYSFLKTIKYK
jgi:hypothetical protein